MLLLFPPAVPLPVPTPPPPGLVTGLTLVEATDALAARLNDPNHVRYLQAELSAYMIESLRVWNALTGAFRDTGVFTTTPGVPFYDVAAQLPALRGYTVTDREIVSLIQYQLLEPATPTAWTGTDMFTLEDIRGALQRRRDQFLFETGMVLGRVTQGLPPTPGGRKLLPQEVLTIRRAAWQTTDGEVMPLHREDVWAFNHYMPSWVQSPSRPPTGVPFGYSVGETPPLTIQDSAITVPAASVCVVRE